MHFGLGHRKSQAPEPDAQRAHSLPRRLRSFLPKVPSPLHFEIKPKHCQRRSSVHSTDSKTSDKRLREPRRSLSDGQLIVPKAASNRADDQRRTTKSLPRKVAPQTTRSIPSSYQLKGFAALFAGLELLSDSMDPTGKTLESLLESGNIVGLYLAGGWSEPCRHFTQQLTSFFSNNNQNFTVVYGSLDRTPSEHANHLYDTGFLSLPHEPPSSVSPQGTLSKTEKVLRSLNIEGIPKLLILGKHGEMITMHGRCVVQWGGEGAVDAWRRGETGLYSCFVKTFKFW
ncbi:uncharacterized protein SPPG_05534 [Spizellomyces punctatus DAOM BR117]|uniref:Thioredoxin-like fold domain-containing protein n=1 Tax=Spizellomyces punctatus (strain DAOM BR117) TaxID=645134 RepID=A0A0L0HCL9_SPIPD|nr:uncharacterized protein SPPG_05534 [Spizellomyces punctatus DAOM BR117]KNC99280.1 hypothetical protein SPPG_05534 [Spizellomyces punctatus DAOM BR117]|eukprot:XP_016607320.1 hypothetical protein SPPG_05534 [Spizellomyces punctatus DAOM BR117]